MTNEKAAKLKHDEMIKVWRRMKVTLLYLDLLYEEYLELDGIDEEDRELYSHLLEKNTILNFIDTFEKAVGLQRLC
jgi:hypothetical protein